MALKAPLTSGLHPLMTSLVVSQEIQVQETWGTDQLERVPEGRLHDIVYELEMASMVEVAQQKANLQA